MSLFICCLSVSILSVNYAFNVDVKFPITFTGQLGSHFGYNVAFLPSSEGVSVLVTAPKSNSSFDRDVVEPGSLFQCSYSSNSSHGSCREVSVDQNERRSFPTRSRLGYLYQEGKTNRWLGVSLDVQQKEPHNVVVCAHRWHNTLFEYRVRGYFPVNGVCYLLDKNFKSSEKLLPLVNPYQQIIPDFHNRKFNIYYYALGQAGISATFSERDEDLVLGAAGVYNWIGTALSYNNISDVKNMGSAVVPNPPLSHDISPDSYLGYSVTTGKFFQNKELYFAAGAPKDKNYNGRVYVFEALSRVKTVMGVRQIMSGEKMGAYFGAAILGVNLNNDEYVDLVVSAPLYSSRSLGDEGRIYVYVSDGVSFQMQKQVIMGRKRAGARFGSAIANCGDLNGDGFNDLAVGAPYEDDHGTVYIYHGSPEGLESQYTQVIAARELFGSVHRGFGINIARSLDADNNGYPDLLVGSYTSDSAVLFRTRPVLHIGLSLNFSVPLINLQEGPKCNRHGSAQPNPCFKAMACLNVEGTHLRSVDVLASLQMDPPDQQMTRDQRGYLFYKGKPSDTILQTIKLTERVSCFTSEVDILEGHSVDVVTPMYFRLVLKLLESQSNISFCPDCPVLDPTRPKSLTKQLSFLIGCKTDFCTADLHIAAKLENFREKEVLIHGANTSITLVVDVRNDGESAYVSELFVRLPPNILIVNQGRCQVITASQTSSFECELGNPLKTNQTEKFSFILDTSRLASDIEEVTIELEVVTTSRDLTPEDNIIDLIIPFKALADITIRGYADRDVIVHAKDVDAITIVHNYLVIKYLPSPVKSVGVAIFIPTMTDSGIPILRIDSIEVGDGTPATVSGQCNVTFGFADSLLPSNEVSVLVEANLTQSEKDTENTIDLGVRAIGQFFSEAITDTTYILSCNNSICSTVICEVGPFTDNRIPALIRITATVNYTNLKLAVGERENVSILTEGRVWILDYNYNTQPENHHPDRTFVTTHLIKQGRPPPQVLPNWVIAVSVGAGILLLGLIIFAMVQLGFFRRKKKEEMQNLLQQATILDNSSFTDNTSDLVDSGEVCADNNTFTDNTSDNLIRGD